ncbi:MAG: Ig-like domain-containing protein, partial [Gemmatimonadota bacterium]|nr:Ig-like domain-containing protein [Gemmatimonadota bacterium]
MRTKKSLVFAVLLALACNSATGPDAGSTRGVATVRINPASSTLMIGAQLPLQVTVEDALGQAIGTAAVVWTVRDPAVVSVSSAGVVTALALGTTQVAANVDGKSAVATVSVQRAPVSIVIVRPDRVDITAGQMVQLTAVAYDAAQNALVDRGVLWTSSNIGVATVDSVGRLTGVSAGVATITATSEGKSATASIAVTEGAVASVLVTPNPLSMSVGQSVIAVATARSATGAIATGRTVVWASSNLSVATVSQDGTVLAVGAGTATITATSEGQTGVTTVTVSNVPVMSVAILPAFSTVTPNASVQLSVVLTDANGVTVTGRPVAWTSSNPAIATVNATTGLVTGVSPGSAVVTGSTEGKSGTAAVNVTQTVVGSVAVTPPTSSLAVGQSAGLAATVTDANGATLTGRVVSWSSNDAAIATVSQAGVVTAVAPGIATITATSEGKSGAAAVTVTAVPAIPVNSVTVSPPTLSVVQGQTSPLTATPRDANNNVLSGRAVTWTSTNAAVATVSAAGVVTGVAPGSATITATSEGKSGTAALTVTAPPGIPVNSVTVSPSTLSLVQGQTSPLTATPRDASNNVLTGRAVTWTSSNEAVATVSSTGVVTAVAPGSATITATSEGKSGTSAITVTAVPVGTVTLTPSSASVGQGETTTLTATVKDTNGLTVTDRPVSWASSNEAVATVSQAGVVTGVAPGTATITATSEGKSGTAALTVTAVPVGTVTLAPSSASVEQGETTTLTATVKDANGLTVTDRPVSWASSDEAVATVSSTGVVTGVAPGSATITATSEGKRGTSALTVTAPPAIPVNSVTVSPSQRSLMQGQTTTLTATPRDAKNKVLTGRVVTWTSSNEAVATVSAAGVVTAVAPGSATITATSEGKSGTSAITVTAVPVGTVTVAPTATSVVQGQTATLTPTVKDANGLTVTDRVVTWVSSNTAAATVSQAGVVTGVAPGSATITATSEGKSGTSSITITPPPAIPVNSVTVSPPTLALVQGQTSPLTATTRDANNNVLTGRVVTWTTSNAAVATVSQAGVVTGVAPGSATITATSEGKTGTSSITVTAVPVGTVTVAPTSASVVQGQTTPLTATVKDANGQTVTDRVVTWTSSNTAVATVSQAGVVTGVAPGSATITATSEGKTGTSSITVTAPAPTPVNTVTVTPSSTSLVPNQTTTLTATTR